MKRIRSICKALLLFYLPSVYSQTAAPEQLKVPLSAPGKIYTLHIYLVNGSIKASVYDGS
jgi:hypothetical protein